MFEYLPALHKIQAENPGTTLYFPDGQAVHVSLLLGTLISDEFEEFEEFEELLLPPVESKSGTVLLERV